MEWCGENLIRNNEEKGQELEMVNTGTCKKVFHKR
jgi:hypothetical protein